MGIRPWRPLTAALWQSSAVRSPKSSPMQQIREARKRGELLSESVVDRSTRLTATAMLRIVRAYILVISNFCSTLPQSFCAN